jgi:hypothetical protein
VKCDPTTIIENKALRELGETRERCNCRSNDTVVNASEQASERTDIASIVK